MGYDQTFDEKELEADLKKKGFDIRVERASESAEDLEATRKIISKIRGE